MEQAPGFIRYQLRGASTVVAPGDEESTDGGISRRRPSPYRLHCTPSFPRRLRPRPYITSSKKKSSLPLMSINCNKCYKNAIGISVSSLLLPTTAVTMFLPQRNADAHRIPPSSQRFAVHMLGVLYVQLEHQFQRVCHRFTACMLGYVQFGTELCTCGGN